METRAGGKFVEIGVRLTVETGNEGEPGNADGNKE